MERKCCHCHAFCIVVYKVSRFGVQKGCFIILQPPPLLNAVAKINNLCTLSKAIFYQNHGFYLENKEP